MILLLLFMNFMYLFFMMINNMFIYWIFLELSMLSMILYFNFFILENKKIMMIYFVIQSCSSLIIFFSIYMNIMMMNIMMMLMFLLKLGIFPFWGWMIKIYPKIKSMVFMFFILVWYKLPSYILLSFFINLNLIYFFMINSIISSSMGISSTTAKSMILFSSFTQSSWLGILSMINTMYFFMFFIVYFMNMSCLFYLMNKKNNYIYLWFFMLLSLSGMPPLWGFWGKLLFFYYLFNMFNFLMSVLMILSSMLSFGFYLMIYIKLLGKTQI